MSRWPGSDPEQELLHLRDHVRRRTLHPPHAAGKVNVTPMIDVVMCLIIFYLLVGKLAMSSRVTDLPKAGSGEEGSRAAAIVLDIMADGDGGGVAVDGTAVPVARLASHLRSMVAGASGGPEVRIRAGRDLPYARLAPVLSACRDSGLTSVRLVAERRP